MRREGRSRGKSKAVRRGCRVCTTLCPGEIQSECGSEGVMNCRGDCGALSKGVARRRRARYGDCACLGVRWTRRKSSSE